MSQGYTRNTVNANLPTGATGTILQGAGAGITPAYSTATYPSTAGTSGKILVSDGTNIVSSTPTFPNASATTRKIIVSDGTNWVASTETWAVPGTSGNVLTSDGTNWTSAAASTGAVINQVRTSTSAATSLGTNIIAGAFTTSTGTQIMSVAITPTSSSHILVIQGQVIAFINGNTGSPGIQNFIVGIFQDATTTPLYDCGCTFDTAALGGFNSSYSVSIPFNYYMTAGTTSSTTFKIRAGATNSSGFQVNSISLSAAAVGFLTAPLSVLFVTEYTT